MVCATLALLALAPARAQQTPPTGSQERAQEQRKHARPNSIERANDLDFLFGALKAAPDEVSAKAVENRIMALWAASGSDTADLLMGRVKQAVDAKDFGLGLELLDAVVEIRPEYVEGWNRRATLHFMQKEFGEAIADLRQVLAREPRHFGALAGLGMILQEIDEEQMALAMFRKALEIHPHMQRIGELVKTLTLKVEGRAI
ncbi:MAG: hypothetical protein IT538_02065 [Variibacter sp.]|nr:hypothetical protein [Variibacter sp.]